MDIIIQPVNSADYFTIEIGYFNTVLEIKQKIQEYQNIPISDQILIFEGITLQDDLNVYNTNILDQSIIQLQILDDSINDIINNHEFKELEQEQPTKKIPLLVKIPTMKISVSFEMDPDDTIGKLKDKISTEIEGDVDSNLLCVQSNGIEFEDHHTVLDCWFSDSTVLYVSILKTNSESFGSSSVNINKKNLKIHLLVKIPTMKISDSFEMDPDDTIGKLKDKISTQTVWVDSNLLCVHSNGIEFENHRTVLDCGFSDSTVLYVSILKTNSKSYGFPSVDFNNKNLKIHLLVKIPTMNISDSFEMDPDDTIGKLKDKISTQIVWVDSNLLCVHSNGIEFENHRTVLDCGFSDSTVLYVSILKTNSKSYGFPSVDFNNKNLKIHLLVKIPTMKISVSFEMDPDDTIGKLKDKISSGIEGVDRNLLCLHSSNGIVFEDHRTVLDCGVSDSTVLYVNILKTNSKSPRSSSVNNINNKNLKVLCKLNHERPDKIEIEVNDFENVSELKKELERLNQSQHLNLPRDGYFFVHKQAVMKEHRSFKWHHVASNDTIHIFSGSISYGNTRNY